MSGGDSPPKRTLPGPSPLGPLGSLGARSASSSRVSMVSTGRMPIISEDDNQLPKKPADTATRPGNRRTVSLPILPPSHKKRPTAPRGGRLGPNGTGPGPAPLGPPITRRSHYRPPSRTRSGQQPSFGLGTIYDGQFARTHSLYIPPHPPPDYYSHPNKGLGVNAQHPGYRDALRRALAGKELPERAPPLKENYTNMEKIRENEWVARRGGWCRIILFLAIIIALIIGLSVGLTLGLKKDDPPSSPASNDPASSDTTPAFPSGSWTMNTALTNVSTSCSANAAAWRCPPYETYSSASPPSDASASFFWTIVPPNPQAGQHGYLVSSADNPFAPQFTNATMTLRDGDSSDERYEFEVSMNRTVAAESGNGLSGFAAGVSCVFPTVFHGIIWTDRVDGGRRNRTLSTSEGQDNENLWPGEIEITQTSSDGPTCTDKDGASVAVAAGRDDAECLCRYANYDLDSGSSSSSSSRRRRRSLQ